MTGQDLCDTSYYDDAIPVVSLLSLTIFYGHNLKARVTDRFAAGQARIPTRYLAQHHFRIRGGCNVVSQRVTLRIYPWRIVVVFLLRWSFYLECSSNDHFVAESPNRTMLINTGYQHKKGRGSVAVVGKVRLLFPTEVSVATR